MSLSLSNLKPAPGARRREKRVGRGNASGHGTYSGRGIKGQKARTGGRGGLKRLGMRRLLLTVPKIGGFRSLRTRPATISLANLEAHFTAGVEINPHTLVKQGLIATAKHGVKILGDGTVTKKFVIKDCKVSESAKEKILAAGGEIK